MTSLEVHVPRINLTPWLTDEGSSYSARYDGYLTVFALLAATPNVLTVTGCPASWAPLVEYLGHNVDETVRVLDTDNVADGLYEFWRAARSDPRSDARHAIEVCCALRPELVHALYLADTTWPCPLVRHDDRESFVVTSNASFFRPEVRAYRRRLANWRLAPNIRHLIVTTCAADKPYPAPHHREVLDAIARHARDPAAWEVVVSTGTLGVVPQTLWDVAPAYDAGLPNLQRTEEAMRWLLSTHAGQLESVVVYSDFCASCIERAARGIISPVFLFGTHYRDTYENLLLREHLDRLSQTIAETP